MRFATLVRLLSPPGQALLGQRACSLLALALCLSACEEKEQPVAPSEPWRAGSREEDEKAAVFEQEYLGSASNRLDFQLARKGNVNARGSLRAAPAPLHLRLDDLSFFHLQLSFPFEGLQATRLHLNPDTSAPAAPGAPATAEETPAQISIDRSRQALQWLRVPSVEDAGGAKDGPPAPALKITALRNLDTRRADQGTIEKSLPAALSERFVQFRSTGEGTELQFRRVLADAVLSLSVNQITIEQNAPVRLYFIYSGAASRSRAPLAVILDWRKPLLVSLAEHQIKPRDAQLNLLTGKLATLATELGTHAELQGPLLFELAPHAEPAKEPQAEPPKE